jgi:hypothetical protein
MFEELGFYKEYYINGKFIGTINTINDGRIIGWEGRNIENITEQIILSNKKKIKVGQTATTIIYPLSGKLLNRNF